ncbi:MAG: c-type cytochrome [Chthoniobacterales bacterium]
MILVVLAGLALIVAGGAFLVSASGVVPIAASSGHWPVTKWFLHFSMKRSISTHSWGIDVPDDLDDEKRILRGAGHYRTGCFECHGGPGARMPVVAAGMTPQPPYLPPRMEQWEDAELFTIVKDGIKFAGMPAWPTPVRDDEVWDVVAFLRELPGMDAAEYGELVDAPGETVGTQTGEISAVGARLAEAHCARCHGDDGLGRGRAWPVLAGQRKDYLARQLRAYREDGRPSGMMEPIARNLSDEAIERLAEHYANLPADVSSGDGDVGMVERGRMIAEQGIAARKLPSCQDCHRPDVNTEYPMLAGQAGWYLVQQLKLFAEGKRGGSSAAHLMDATAPQLQPEEMRDVAAYFEQLPPTVDGRDESTPAP